MRGNHKHKIGSVVTPNYVRTDDDKYVCAYQKKCTVIASDYGRSLVSFFNEDTGETYELRYANCDLIKVK
jgi:hypothetical protein